MSAVKVQITEWNFIIINGLLQSCAVHPGGPKAEAGVLPDWSQRSREGLASARALCRPIHLVQGKSRSENIGGPSMHCEDAAELREHGVAKVQWKAEGIAPEWVEKPWKALEGCQVKRGCAAKHHE
ncbi:hypothetical protein GGX14DRAFT_391331 [Mycena pura]|uniref:Uncharacterized protein n=1 Tax=Mycena pura TaxID=153505 RepID=A0AAD6VLF8_9AGAR|nr:hypothetical protein GGX14DRAFT_391331 [Mycena pura]